MLWTPQKGPVTVINNYGIVGGAPGVLVPSNATTLLDGAVTELISAAANVQDSWGIAIEFIATGAATAASEACLDLLIGGATDDVLIPALICGNAAATHGGVGYFFPLHIPQGVRLAATLASVRTSISARVGVTLYGGGIPPFRVGSKVTAYGTQINNARGQAVTPTASGGAASVTEMTASSSVNHFAFMPGFQISDSTMTARNYSIGIGVGASTEERIGSWFYGVNADEFIIGPLPRFPTFQDVPAGTRLTLLASNSGTNDASYDGLIYGVS